MFWSFFLDYVHVYLNYIFAAALLLGGGYFVIYGRVSPLRYLGVAMIIFGGDIAVGSYFYSRGLSEGGAVVQAEWKKKNYEAQLEKLNLELKVKNDAADLAAKQASDLAAQNDDLQKQVSDYQQATANLSVCRHSTADDDRRMCQLTGNSAAGCSNSK